MPEAAFKKVNVAKNKLKKSGALQKEVAKTWSFAPKDKKQQSTENVDNKSCKKSGTLLPSTPWKKTEWLTLHSFLLGWVHLRAKGTTPNHWHHRPSDAKQNQRCTKEMALTDGKFQKKINSQWPQPRSGLHVCCFRLPWRLRSCREKKELIWVCCACHGP